MIGRFLCFHFHLNGIFFHQQFFFAQSTFLFFKKNLFGRVLLHGNNSLSFVSLLMPKDYQILKEKIEIFSLAYSINSVSIERTDETDVRPSVRPGCFCNGRQLFLPLDKGPGGDIQRPPWRNKLFLFISPCLLGWRRRFKLIGVTLSWPFYSFQIHHCPTDLFDLYQGPSIIDPAFFKTKKKIPSDFIQFSQKGPADLPRSPSSSQMDG